MFKRIIVLKPLKVAVHLAPLVSAAFICQTSGVDIFCYLCVMSGQNNVEPSWNLWVLQLGITAENHPSLQIILMCYLWVYPALLESIRVQQLTLDKDPL